MRNVKKEITKEIYDRAVSNHGFLKPADYNRVFTTQEVMGYGVYNETLAVEDGKFYVKYQIGDSCD